MKYRAMKRPIQLSVLLPFIVMQMAQAEEEQSRLAELDAYWGEVSRAVREGDFEGYKATVHKEGILVSGISKKSEPLSEALKRWKQDFENTKAGTKRAIVNFRFTRRLGDATTAHETGIFHYETVDLAGKAVPAYIHFEALLTKKDSQWLILMEYQKSKATLKEWDALGATRK